jgi:hypothetical protein
LAAFSGRPQDVIQILVHDVRRASSRRGWTAALKHVYC